MSNAIICDVCGKMITKDYKFLTIEDTCIKNSLRVIIPKNLDVCPDCWEKVEAVLAKEKDHEGSDK